MDVIGKPSTYRVIRRALPVHHAPVVVGQIIAAANRRNRVAGRYYGYDETRLHLVAHALQLSEHFEGVIPWDPTVEHVDGPREPATQPPHQLRTERLVLAHGTEGLRSVRCRLSAGSPALSLELLICHSY